MSGIACLLHQLREQFFIQRHTVGLTGPYDLVLHARVDLRSQKKKNLRIKCVFSLQKEEPSVLVVTVFQTIGLVKICLKSAILLLFSHSRKEIRLK